MRRRLADDSAVGMVTIVEPPVSHWYARRARLAFICVSLGCWAIAGAVLWVFTTPLLAVGLGLVAGVLLGLVTAVLVRVWPVLRVLWWWSFEIAAVVFVVGGWVVLAHATTWWIALLALLSAATALVAPHRLREWLWAWSWCLIVRHRLRLCFATLVRSTAQIGGSRPAALPLLLWARPTPAGERVWLWLRPGLSLEHLEKDERPAAIAVACIAKQIRLNAASEHYAALVRVDITRRDPLTGRVESPLALLIPSLRTNDDNADVPVSPAVPPLGLELADIELDEPAAKPTRGGGRR
ncbi:hypothetical protein [Actinoplanes aureus]|uniref:Uncharacterized protein n=1 Tax=Actinoplanes aureus TaxID=2792083 RepID=A0A931CDF4_9ACTN|nr:hypothetical protein [Actinoplanes aureus]MBG0568074.1 hypothetical protein [Actinoplanes aureus]